MVRKDSGITSTSQFKSGISACTNIGTTTELNMRDFFTSKGISYEPVAFEKLMKLLLLMTQEDATHTQQTNQV